jgi:glycosyltransferase involved in cell wall biosynthesis
MDSLIAQDYPNLEIVIVDDCSTDKTQQILDEYADKHDFIKLHVNDSIVRDLRLPD